MTWVKPTLDVDAWEAYAAGTRGDHFAWWCQDRLKLGQSQWAGTQLVLEPSWQLPIMSEALAVDDEMLPYWRTVVLVVPRKCAKTTTLGAYALYSLVDGQGDPEILLAAGSDKQAGRLFRVCTGFVRRSQSLKDELVLREYIGEVARADGEGRIERLSSEGQTQHGANPSLVVIDELAWWRTPTLRRSWAALTTADGARNDTQVFAITTEGEANGRSESILGELVDGNEAMGDVERMAGVTISRDHDSRQLVYRFHAVNARLADPRPLRNARSKAKSEPSAEMDAEVEALEQELLASVMPANIASWITEEYILGQARSAKVMPYDFLQLHACVAAEARDVWISADRWEACGEPGLSVPAGANVCLAVDASYSHDTTAVSWAWQTDDQRTGVGVHVWAAREDAPAHDYQSGGVIRMEPVKDWIIQFCSEHQVSEIAFDPAYFRETAETLQDMGLPMLRMDQQTTAMRDAEQVFHDSVLEGKIAHDGDDVLRRHVASVVASRRPNGAWRIRPIDQIGAIDGVVAAIMAVDRSQRTARKSEPMVAFL